MATLLVCFTMGTKIVENSKWVGKPTILEMESKNLPWGAPPLPLLRTLGKHMVRLIWGQKFCWLVQGAKSHIIRMLRNKIEQRNFIILVYNILQTHCALFTSNLRFLVAIQKVVFIACVKMFSATDCSSLSSLNLIPRSRCFRSLMRK